MLLNVGREVMHERVIRIRTRPVAVSRERRILVIFSLTDIAVRLPLDSGLEGAFLVVPSLVPVVFEGCCKIHLLGVCDLV